MNIIRFSLIVLTCALQIISCATRGSPGGGPVDRTVPEIVNTLPASDSVRVSPFLSKIEIYFSERMEEASVGSNLFISPFLKYELEWRGGDELHILINDTLASDQTYVLTIGAGASDEHQNKMKQSRSVAFSTGIKLDRGWARGKVFGLKKDETATLFAYMLDDSLYPDPRYKEPLYRSQTGKAGDFHLEYMKDGLYRIFAVQDQNSNLILDAVYERVGIPFSDIIVDSIGPVPERLFFRMALVDTTLPEIVDLRSVYDVQIQLRTSEPVIISASTYLLKDSVNQQALRILGISQNIENASIIDIFTDSLQDGRVYTLSTSTLQDSAGNLQTAVPDYSFSHRARQDTAKFKFVEFLPTDSVTGFHPLGEVFIEFSHPVQWQSVDTNFSVNDSLGKIVSGKWQASSFYDGVFKPDNHFIPGFSYMMQIETGKIEDLWHRVDRDTVIKRFMTIASDRDMGEMSGKVIYRGETKDSVVISIVKLDRGKIAFQTKQPVSEPFEFSMLPEGDYRIEGFVDLDGDNQYSYGSLVPFQFAEPFSVSTDTVNIRKRWEKTGVELLMPSSAAPQ